MSSSTTETGKPSKSRGPRKAMVNNYRPINHLTTQPQACAERTVFCKGLQIPPIHRQLMVMRTGPLTTDEPEATWEEMTVCDLWPGLPVPAQLVDELERSSDASAGNVRCPVCFG